MRFHCLFEQSGTFKNVLQNLGYQAIDYDIDDKFGQTDVKVDIFNEIDKWFDGKSSIFDGISPDDYILTFFPCVRFSKMIIWSITGQAYQCRDWLLEKKVLNSSNLIDEVAYFYKQFCKLVYIAQRCKFKMIVENPYDPQSFLIRYFPKVPDFIEMDRTRYGDSYKKPTMFFFFNCKPLYNIYVDTPVGSVKSSYQKTKGFDRSRITPEYAMHFLREMVLPLS